MRNLSRYGAGSEKRLRRWASEYFDVLELNTNLLSKYQVISRHPQRVREGSHRQAIVIDATFLRKSGAQEGLGYFHNGSSSALNELDRDLEMSLIALVNLEERSAYALSMHQSVEQSALKVSKDELYSRKIVIKVDHRGKRRVLCSTEITLSVEEILNLYEARFQIEFLFRDAKQHTGLVQSLILDSKG